MSTVEEQIIDLQEKFEGAAAAIEILTNNLSKTIDITQSMAVSMSRLTDAVKRLQEKR